MRSAPITLADATLPECPLVTTSSFGVFAWIFTILVVAGLSFILAATWNVRQKRRVPGTPSRHEEFQKGAGVDAEAADRDS